MRAKLADSYPNAFFTTQAGTVLRKDEGYGNVNDEDPEVKSGLASGIIIPECLDDDDIKIIQDVTQKNNALKEVVTKQNTKELKQTVEGLKEIPPKLGEGAESNGKTSPSEND